MPGLNKPMEYYRMMDDLERFAYADVLYKTYLDGEYIEMDTEEPDVDILPEGAAVYYVDKVKQESHQVY